MAAALREAREAMAGDVARISGLRDSLAFTISERVEGVHLTGAPLAHKDAASPTLSLIHI